MTRWQRGHLVMTIINFEIYSVLKKPIEYPLTADIAPCVAICMRHFPIISPKFFTQLLAIPSINYFLTKLDIKSGLIEEISLNV